MCYNCGCQKPNDDIGNPKSITNRTFEEAAKASRQKSDEAKKNMMELLETARRTAIIPIDPMLLFSLAGRSSDLRRSLRTPAFQKIIDEP